MCLQIICFTHTFAQFVNNKLLKVIANVRVTLISDVSDLHLRYNFVSNEIVLILKTTHNMQKYNVCYYTHIAAMYEINLCA